MIREKIEYESAIIYRPADMTGHDRGLQIGRPVLLSTSKIARMN